MHGYGSFSRQAGSSLAIVAVLVSLTVAADWDRFRGPNGSGVSPDGVRVPIRWSESENVQWKRKLPGPGHSSPIVVRDRVFVTCWSGYGVDRGDPGRQQDLRLHLVSINRNTGETLWDKAVEPALPEEPYQGMFTQHGYATHTPTSDGERVYVFFGKTGVFAFDFEGNRLWQKSVGTESDPRGWGSASSPILFDNLIIVTASTESEALVALNRETGEEVWRQEASGLGSTWGTPVLVDVDEGRTDLVLAVPYEIWGMNPSTGKLRWFCDAVESNSMCASVVSHDDVVYFVGGRSGGSIAVRAGGKGDVTNTHVLWSGLDRARISTPVYHEGNLYWINGGIANCIEAKTGNRVYQSRLTGVSAERRPGRREREIEGRDSGRRSLGGGFGGGRGRGRGQDYSSPVAADGKMFFVSRSGDTYVIALGSQLETLAKNRFSSDDGDYSATPAISKGQLFIRSTNHLYCVASGSP